MNYAEKLTLDAMIMKSISMSYSKGGFYLYILELKLLNPEHNQYINDKLSELIDPQEHELLFHINHDNLNQYKRFILSLISNFFEESIKNIQTSEFIKGFGSLTNSNAEEGTYINFSSKIEPYIKKYCLQRHISFIRKSPVISDIENGEINIKKGMLDYIKLFTIVNAQTLPPELELVRKGFLLSIDSITKDILNIVDNPDLNLAILIMSREEFEIPYKKILDDLVPDNVERVLSSSTAKDTLGTAKTVGSSNSKPRFNVYKKDKNTKEIIGVMGENLTLDEAEEKILEMKSYISHLPKENITFEFSKEEVS